mgnify:FL=1
MTKLKGWEERLTLYIAHNMRHVSNCGVFANGCVKAITGENHMAGFPEFDTIAEGMRHLKDMGYSSHVDFVADKLTEIPVHEAMPGDLVVVEERSLGIMQGLVIYACSERNHINIVSASEAQRAFRT